MSSPSPARPGRPPVVLVAYLAGIFAAGAAVLAVCVQRLPAAWLEVQSGARMTLLALAVLLVIAEMRPLDVQRRGIVDGVTLSGVFACALLLQVDWSLVVLVQVVATLLDDARSRIRWWKSAFNVGQYAVSLAAAGLVMGLGTTTVSTSPGLALGLAGCATLFVVNHCLAGTLFALIEGVDVVGSLLDDLPFQASVNGTVIAMAPLVVAVGNDSPWLVLLLLVPVMAVHRGARASIDRTHLSLHDPLTGLPNLVAFRDALGRHLDDAGAQDHHVAVLVLSLDHFSDVNHTLGHAAGEDLLRQVADRLRAAAPGATVARGDGGGFLVAIPDLPSPARANDLAEQLQQRFSAPYAIAESEFTLRASVGMTLSPLHGTDPDRLLQHAEVARDLACRTHTALEVYSPARNEFTDRRLALIGGLGPALRRREMQVHFQPQVDLTTGVVNGYEALLRWDHPTLGSVPPDEFVALAEHAGAMPAITEFVLDEALSRVAEWRALGATPRVSINVSASVLSDLELPGRVARRLAIWGVPSSALVIELTETAVMADPDRCRQVMEGLRDLHVGLSLDDYGTGYASLTSLTSLPIDEVKIDKCFVMGMMGNRTDRVVVRSTLQLARQLGLRVVAEGVETEDLARLLTFYGCHTAQGYHFGRAVPSHEVVLPDAVPHSTVVLPS